MSGKILTVMKKEFARFFGDKRMVVTTLFLPAIMIYLVYSFMGDGLMTQFSVSEDYVSKIYVCNMPESLSGIFQKLPVEVLDSEKLSLDEMKEDVQAQEVDLLSVFPEDFDSAVQEYDAMSSTEPAPQVEIYYNSVSTESTNIYSTLEEVLANYESSMCNKFDINTKGEDYDLATEEDMAGKIFSMMLPMLLMIFIYSGCMGIATESIAGEKERGTIAKLLVSPTQRSAIALGKIFSLSILGLLCGASSFIGTLLSLPKLMQTEEMSASVYSVGDYIMLMLIILSTVLVIVGLLSVISTFAKTVKEATTYVTPVMIIVMLVGVTSMFGEGAPTKAYLYMIPFYNSVQCMNGIFGFSYQIGNIVTTIGANIVITAVLSFVLSKMFNNEKIMFS